MIRIITLALCLSFASMSFGAEFSCDDSDMIFCPLFVEDCRNSPDVSACIVLSSYKIIIIKEICESDVACQEKHAKAMDSFDSFFGENMYKLGMGNAAVNMCMPFHRYQPSSEIGKDYYNRLEEASPDLGLGASNDYPALWACVEEKYQTLMMDLLTK
jgi:hypothetical protein